MYHHLCIKFSHIYTINTAQKVHFLLLFILFCSFCYLKFILPLMLHLELFSSCGQFLGSETREGFRVETTPGIPPSKHLSHLRKPEQKRSALEITAESTPETREKWLWSHLQSSNHRAIKVSQHSLSAKGHATECQDVRMKRLYSKKVVCVCGAVRVRQRVWNMELMELKKKVGVTAGRNGSVTKVKNK